MAFHSLLRMEGFVLLTRRATRDSYFSRAWGTSGPVPFIYFLDWPARNFNLAVCRTRSEKISEPP